MRYSLPRTQCGILHAAPLSRGHSKRSVRYGPGSATHRFALHRARDTLIKLACSIGIQCYPTNDLPLPGIAVQRTASLPLAYDPAIHPLVLNFFA